MRIAIPTTPVGQVDQSWGRAPRVTVAQVENDTVTDWLHFDVVCMTQTVKAATTRG